MRRRSARLSSFNPRARTGLAVFFADPYAAWQRGTNGLLRQYFPKRSDLRALTHDDLAQALQKLNHRPRKVLESPHEVIFTALRGALAT
jgi:transposase, IS30 family